MSITKHLGRLAAGMVMLLLILLSSAGYAGAQDSAKKSAEGIIAEFKEQLQQASAMPDTEDDAGMYPSAVEDSLAAAQQGEYYAYSMMHMKRTFTWQYYSGIFIFIIVVSIVLMGLYLSYRQFRLQEWKMKHPAATAVTEKTEESVTTLELGKDGIKINSAVIGLIILTVSLVFFFLYLKYVYPIHMLSLGKP